MPSTGNSASRRSAAARGLAWRRALAAALLLALPSCERPAAAFEGKRAFEWLVRQCAFGPRVPGTAAHDSCFAYVVGRLRALAPVVEADTFAYDSPELKREVRLMNAVARFEPRAKERILFGAHWDSRPWADKDPDLARRSQPVLGANDGASGVAVLLELARVLKGRPLPIGVDLALFDGEDLGTDGNPDGYFRGSMRYVEWKRLERPPLFVVVIDMVGRQGMTLHWEAVSREQATNIVDLVWGEARELNIRSFRSDVRHRLYDDHIPFLNAGIPAITVVDFDFPEWHTTHDIPAVCSAQSLEDVGRVLLNIASRASFLSR